MKLVTYYGLPTNVFFKKDATTRKINYFQYFSKVPQVVKYKKQ